MTEPLTCDRCTDKGHCPEYKAGSVCVIEHKKNQEVNEDAETNAV